MNIFVLAFLIDKKQWNDNCYISEFRKTSANDLYFVTLTIVGWVNLFDREIYKQIIVDNLSYCQDKEHLEIFSYVIMSNHILLSLSQDRSWFKWIIRSF